MANRFPIVLKGVAFWFGVWIALVVAICGAGAAAGALLYPIVGSLLQMELGLQEMALNGVMDGAFYALIWAPGASLVACIMWAHKRSRQSA